MHENVEGKVAVQLLLVDWRHGFDGVSLLEVGLIWAVFHVLRDSLLVVESEVIQGEERLAKARTQVLEVVRALHLERVHQRLDLLSIAGR